MMRKKKAVSWAFGHPKRGEKEKRTTSIGVNFFPSTSLWPPRTTQLTTRFIKTISNKKTQVIHRYIIIMKVTINKRRLETHFRTQKLTQRHAVL